GGPHPDGVRDQHAVGAELAAQELGQGGAAECGGQVRAEGGDAQVAAHDRPDAGLDGGAEGRQVAFGEQVAGGVHGGQRQVGVGGGVAVAWEVFGAGGDAGTLEAGHEGGGVAGDGGGAGAEGADADDGVGGVGVDVGGGRVVEGDAGGGEHAAEPAADASGEVDVVDHAERPVAGHGAAGLDFEAGDGAAFLVDGDDRVRAPFADLPGGEVERVVAGEEHDAAEALVECPAHPVGKGGSRVPWLEHGHGQPGQVKGHSAFSFTVVDLKVIFCHRRPRHNRFREATPHA